MTTPVEVIKLIEDNDVKFVDLRICLLYTSDAADEL